MLAMDVWCFSKSTARIDLEKHQTRLHYWGISLCNFGESPLQFWVFLLYTKQIVLLLLFFQQEQVHEYPDTPSIDKDIFLLFVLLIGTPQKKIRSPHFFFRDRYNRKNIRDNSESLTNNLLFFFCINSLMKREIYWRITGEITFIHPIRHLECIAIDNKITSI